MKGTDTAAQTTSAAHTPGPWEWINQPYENGNPYIVITAGIGYYGAYDGKPGFRMTGLATEGDARLIAAAPDLLAVAEFVLAHPNAARGMGEGPHYAWADLQVMARAAIAKARGSEPAVASDGSGEAR